MGEQRRKDANARSVAFAKTDRCIYCGGFVPATTVDHCPPRAMFSNRQWPEGYVFPACQPCNAEAKEAENWVAFMARINSGPGFDEQAEADEMFRIARPILKPEVIRSMSMSGLDKKAIARRIGVTKELGKTYADIPLIKVPKEAKNAIDYFSRKVVKALHFEHTKRVVPVDAAIKRRWFTNYNEMEGKIPPEIFTIPTGIPTLERTKVNLSRQFNYLYTVSAEGDLGVYTIEFRQSFCIFVMVAFNPDIVSKWEDSEDIDELPEGHESGAS